MYGGSRKVVVNNEYLFIVIVKFGGKSMGGAKQWQMVIFSPFYG